MVEADSNKHGAAEPHDGGVRGQGALADDGALTGVVNDTAGGGDRTAQADRSTPRDDAAGSKGEAADVDLPGVTASGAE